MLVLRLILFAIVIILCLSSSIFAQGDYLDRDLGGVQVGGGALLNSDWNGIEAGFSSYFFEYFELGLTVGTSLDSDNPSVSYLSPSLVLYPTKYEKLNLPVSLALAFSHTEYDYSYDDMSMMNIDSYSRSAGGILYRNFSLNPTIVIQTRVSYAYKWGYFNSHSTVGYEIDEWVSGAGLSFFKTVKRRMLLRFDIGAEMEDSETTVFIRAGLIHTLSGGK